MRTIRNAYCYWRWGLAKGPTLCTVTAGAGGPFCGDGFIITNNRIHETGNEYHGCAGVTAGYVANAEITHNDIANSTELLTLNLSVSVLKATPLNRMTLKTVRVRLKISGNL